MPGFIGGAVGYHLVKALGGSPPRRDPCSGAAYRDRSKVEVLFGPAIWDDLRGRVVLDFGCGTGEHAIEVARRGAARVIGLDIQEARLAEARRRAVEAGVADRCRFVTRTDEPVDVVISLDAFEHFDNPAEILAVMGERLAPSGHIIVAFGPPWYHPKGGHLFSIFPWAHLLFSERAFMRWWADFKSDGATKFSEVAGGLNRMSVGRFRRLVHESGFECVHLETVPIRRARWLCVGPLREFFTSVVRCRLRRPASA